MGNTVNVTPDKHEFYYGCVGTTSHSCWHWSVTESHLLVPQEKDSLTKHKEENEMMRDNIAFCHNGAMSVHLIHFQNPFNLISQQENVHFLSVFLFTLSAGRGIGGQSRGGRS